MLLGPLARVPAPEGCPACSGLLLVPRRVGWAGPRQKRLCVPGWWRSVRP